MLKAGRAADKALDVANATDNVVDAGKVADRAASTADCLINSFSADTLVMTAGGAKPIAALVEGDIVLAYNEATGKVGPYPIVDTISHVDPAIVLLTIDGETLETTAEHPFYEMEGAPWLAVGQTEGRWTDALDLENGDLVWQADGTTGVVQSSEIVAREQRMYNLTVDVAHTFFVGQQQWLVHNAGPCGVTLQSKAGVVADAHLKGYHINITNLRKGGVELSLQPGANNTILISTVGRGSAQVDAGSYLNDVNTLLAHNSSSVIDQLNGIVSKLGAKHHRSQEAQKLIEMINAGTYTVAAK